MSKFTPGPWMYDDTEEMVKTVARFANGRRCITNILPQGGDREWNGFLIAAAPAMYEALQWAMVHLQEVGGEDNPEYVKARAVLKAATGE